MDDFVHLHVHTQFSLLDGAIKIPELMERVNEHSGRSAVAMTDHGNMYGAVDFQKAAHDADVQPIIGCEMYMTDEADFRNADSPESYHLTLLAKNLEGYYNLAYLNSMAWLQGYHEPSETPRISREFLAEHNEGLICLSGDLGSRINQAILSEDYDEAREIALAYKEMFPEEHYYLEIMHNAFPEQQTCTETLIEMSDELDIPLVATNDCHYLDPEDARAQAILMCIQLGKTVELEKLMDHGIEDFHLRSPEEMRELFSHVPEACDNTLKIADMCDVEIPLGEIFLPDCDVPDWFIEDRGLEEAGQNTLVHEYFEHSAREGLEERFEEFDQQGKEYDREEYIDRLEDEIGIIREMDYPGYFLIVADFIQWAKDQDIPVGPGRGSGAGSLVAYAMRITGLDPIPYDLLFERFLNPERVSMPDFDIDFCMNQRGDVIDYVTDKYGEKNVGQIITYGKMKAKGAVRDVGRTLNFSYDEIDEVADLIPDDADDLDDALTQEPKLRGLTEERDEIDAWIDIAQSVENINRQCSIHAAGVVISDDPVWERVPVKLGDNGEMVTQYAMEQVEEAGLVKFDFLGLKTLTVIDTAAELINRQRGPDEPEFDPEEDIPLDDPGMYELISSGDTTGVFQLESEGFQRILQRLKPEEFEEVVASVALYRPGPLGSGMVDDYIDRKHGRKEVEYPHPWLEDVLEPTYGVMVYQEQVMQTAQIMSGYSLGEADLLRRCVTGDTKVVRADTGERVRVDEVEPGMPVSTLGGDYEFDAVPVEERLHNGTKQTYRVETKTGRSIELTENHPLLTVQGWEHLSDLEEGDAIAVPAALPVEGARSPDPPRVKVLAYLIGDGQTRLSDGSATARFYNSDADIVADYRECAAALGASTKVYDNEDGSPVVTCKSADGGANPILELVREADCAYRSEHKRMPEEVFSYDETSLKRFLGALWSTDGSVEADRLSYSSSSERLVDEVSHLLLRLGIPTVRRSRETSHLRSYELIVTDQRDVLQFAEQLQEHLCVSKAERLDDLVEDARERSRGPSIYNVPKEVTHLIREAKYESGLSWREAGGRIGRSGNKLSSGLNFETPKRDLSRHRLERLGEGFDSAELRHLADADVLWDPIVDITPAGEAEVYDLAVPPHANFVASDCVIHNSMGKKKAKVMKKQRKRFVEGAVDKDVDEAKAEEIFDLMAQFASYGFNKSHSAAYAVLTCQTAYLKTHHPVEFMAALMTCDRDDSDKIVGFLNEAKDMGIEVLPPDVNESNVNFSVSDGKIRFGMAAIKGVGASVLESIIEAREEGGPYESLYDFCERVDLSKVNSSTIETLVESGAFDTIGPVEDPSYIGDIAASRASMHEAVDRAVERGEQQQHDEEVGQSNIFGMMSEDEREEVLEESYPDVDPWSERELLDYERELLGFYVTGHPLDRYEDAIGLFDVTDIETVVEGKQIHDGQDMTIAGVIGEYSEQPLKSREGRMAFVTLEDQTGRVEVLVFSRPFERYEEELKSGEPLLIRGDVMIEGDGDARTRKIRADEIERIDHARRDKVQHLCVDLDAEDVQDGELEELERLFEEHDGPCRASLVVSVDAEEGTGRATLPLPEAYTVEPTNELLSAIDQLFGKRVVELRRSRRR